MKLNLLGLLLLAGVAVTSCKKNDAIENVENKPLDELVVPKGFSWSGARDVKISAGITDKRFLNAIHVIKIYSAEPSKGGEIVAKGAATLVSPFNSKFSLPSSIKEIYVEKVAPDGSKVGYTVPLTSDDLSLAVGTEAITRGMSATGLVGKMKLSHGPLNVNLVVPTETSPDCNDANAIELTSALTSNGNYVMQTGKVYVVKQPMSINFWQEQQSGYTLRVCATGVTLTNLKIKQNSTVVVSSGANVTFSNFAWESTGTFKNFGTVSGSANVEVKGTFVNQGTINWSNTSFTVAANSTFTNTNALTVSNFTTYSPWANSGTINTQGFTVEGTSASGTNTGTLNLTSNFKTNSPLANSGSIKVPNGQFVVSANSAITNTGPITVSNNFKTESPIANSSTITISGEGVFDSGSNFDNSGTVSVGGNFSNNGPFINSGTITLKGGFNDFKSSSNVSNTSTGKLTLDKQTTIDGNFNSAGEVKFLSGLLQSNGNSKIINSGLFEALTSEFISRGIFSNNSGGSVTVYKLTQNSGGSVITNNCKYLVLTDADVDQVINNNSYFKVTNNLKLNGSGRINLANAAYFETNTINTMDGFIEGVSGTTSLFRLRSTMNQDRINEAAGQNPGEDKAKFRGALQLCATNYQTLPAGLFRNGAARGCDVYIAETPCMPTTNGTPPVVVPPAKPDSDLDGVIDDEDDYDYDDTRAFQILSYNFVNGGSTVAFEDNWPLEGDYDLNDVVISYKYEISTDKYNKVVFVQGEYKLLATGGSFKNGAGVQMDIPANKVSNFSGTNGEYLENGHTKVVVVLFEDSRSVQTHWNTEPGKPKSNPISYKFSFKVTDGPALLDFGSSNHNPFIWNASYGRGYETHMAGKAPTSKATPALFGTGADSGTGTYYTTKNGLPWAIEVPTANFYYPVERTKITEAYTRFSNWALSSGASSQDWYNNSDYAVGNKLYEYPQN